MNPVKLAARIITGTLDLRAGLRGDTQRFLQLQITIRNTGGTVAEPGTGTLTVKAKGPAAETFLPILNGTIDVTSQANWLQFVNQIVAEELEFTPASLPADWTYEVVATTA